MIGVFVCYHSLGFLAVFGGLYAYMYAACMIFVGPTPTPEKMVAYNGLCWEFPTLKHVWWREKCHPQHLDWLLKKMSSGTSTTTSKILRPGRRSTESLFGRKRSGETSLASIVGGLLDARRLFGKVPSPVPKPKRGGEDHQRIWICGYR